MRRKIATLALAGGACLALAIPMSVAQASPAAPGPQHTDSASSRCLLWLKTTDGPKGYYSGATAGYSWAWNVTVSQGDSGPRVQEIQCLTDYWVGEPTLLDGQYGPATAQAVSDAQALLPGCSADGVVGPDTWRCLRLGVF